MAAELYTKGSSKQIGESWPFCSHSLLQHSLPFSLSLADREMVHLALYLCSPLAHVVLNVKHKGVLPKVSIHHFPWGLQANCGVQVGLRGEKIWTWKTRS